MSTSRVTLGESSDPVNLCDGSWYLVRLAGWLVTGWLVGATIYAKYQPQIIYKK